VKRARARIDAITHVPEVGNVYDGRVASLMPYGVFVDFMGRSGLLHISEVSHSRIDKIEDVFSEGDLVKVKLIEIDKRTGKYRLSRKALIPKPQKVKSEANEDQGDRQP
jgi:polyribonucleotide nucleotidyltransferase